MQRLSPHVWMCCQSSTCHLGWQRHVLGTHSSKLLHCHVRSVVGLVVALPGPEQLVQVLQKRPQAVGHGGEGVRALHDSPPSCRPQRHPVFAVVFEDVLVQQLAGRAIQQAVEERFKVAAHGMHVAAGCKQAVRHEQWRPGDHVRSTPGAAGLTLGQFLQHCKHMAACALMWHDIEEMLVDTHEHE